MQLKHLQSVFRLGAMLLGRTPRETRTGWSVHVRQGNEHPEVLFSHKEMQFHTELPDVDLTTDREEWAALPLAPLLKQLKHLESADDLRISISEQQATVADTYGVCTYAIAAPELQEAPAPSKRKRSRKKKAPTLFCVNPPTMPHDAPTAFVVDGNHLQQQVHAVRVACCEDQNRYGIGGLHIQHAPDDLNLGIGMAEVLLLGTDGHRLHCAALRDVEFQNGAGVDKIGLRYAKGCGRAGKFILETSSTKALERVLAAMMKRCDDPNVHAAFQTVDFQSHPFVRLHSDTGPGGAPWTLTMRIIDGEFPDWRSVLPSRTDETVVVQREPLAKRLAAMASWSKGLSAYPICRVTVRPDGSTELLMNTYDAGARSSVVPPEELPLGKPRTIGLNPNLLVAMLKHAFRSSFVRLTLENNSLRPLTASSEEDGVMCVVMPMRLD